MPAYFYRDQSFESPPKDPIAHKDPMMRTTRKAAMMMKVLIMMVGFHQANLAF
jgi:hypothetical protein